MDSQTDSVRHRSRMPVRGMTCAVCAGRIEKMVGRMEGVETVAVNLATEVMDVTWDDRTDLDAIVRQVSALGFEAMPPDAAPAGGGNDLRFAVSGMMIENVRSTTVLPPLAVRTTRVNGTGRVVR